MTCLALAVMGCRRHRSLTPLDFMFVTTNTTFGQVIQKLGGPDRGYSRSNVTVCEWDLTSNDFGNKYVMILKGAGGLDEFTNRVQTVELVSRRDFIDFSSNRTSPGESHLTTR